MNGHAILVALTLAATGCASTPPAAPEIARLQAELDRLHRDPRVADNGGAELGRADGAVDSLARDHRVLGATEREQRIYVADRLVRIAEASGRARYAEERSRELGLERERLLARAAPPATSPRHASPVSGEWLPPERRTLLAIQDRLPNMESRLDARGLVVRLGGYQFQPEGSEPTATAERSLDQLVLALREEPAARVSIEGVGAAGEGDLAFSRANAVRDYLGARGIDSERVTVRTAGPYAAQADRRVDVVILAAR